ncbi:PREDICTED: uncharacterized protein LOC109581917 isoform X2 [Amphimedon queenslandica]|uniref:PX domain-containing protein n=1 Tax=Amphimedon queenslandica TaxID=400682 RepID=A0AAN0J5E8_AMPQE|nr:PREDICTED: uncharacterized protein LOC109581917 isoform X2 [Amphimedon queenslandica]|eukprot:XP_019851972.1 PREDICTED: uncharacterized protein LOC109581917 isoform X2 [Amphimedon queenslandica]
MEFVSSRKPFHWEGGAGGQVGRDYEIIGDPRPGNNMSASSSASGSTRVEWPLFPTPTISLLQVSGYEVYNGTPYYSIVVCMTGGFRWSVLKSYDELAYLNKQLVEEFAIDKSLFPQRKMFGSHKKEQIVEIQSRLSVYLGKLLLQFSLPPVILLRFLDYKFSDVLSITETLSALFFEKGDEFLSTNSMVAFSPLQLHCVCKRMILPIVSEQRDMRYEFGHLLEFLQHLNKVKICPPSKELFPLSPAVELVFDLSVMKSLDTLVLSSIQLHQIQGLGNIPEQLLTLGVHRSITSLRDILKHNCLGVDEAASSDGGFIQWNKLRVMDLSYNNITSIDTSLTLCPNLEELNISNNLIRDIDNLLDLPHLRILDLSHNELLNVSDLHYRLGNITTLCLAHNKLSSLSGVEKCYSVVCLDIQYNLISKVGEMSRLASLPVLEQLMVKGNAFTSSPSYRQQVFSLLPSTAPQVYLDGRPPSRDELEISASLSVGEIKKHSKKQKKSSIRNADINPDIGEASNDRSPGIPSLSAGTRLSIEKMRREGGENWLKMLNERPINSPGKVKKKRKPRKDDFESGGSDQLSSETPSSGLPSVKLQQLLEGRDCNSPWSCTATVLQYSRDFKQLSHHGIERLLADSSCDSCLLEVDVKVGRIIEDFAVASGTGGNRRTRDLTFLKEVRCHEGQKSLAIAIELSSMMSHTTWVVYCLRDYPSIADLYVLLQKRLQSSEVPAPPSPAFLSKQLSAASDEEPDNERSRQLQTAGILEETDDNKLLTTTDPPQSEERSHHEEEDDDEDSYKSLEGGITDPLSLAQSPTIPVDSLEYFVRKSSQPPQSPERPQLDDDMLLQYFTNQIAKEKGEMLMYVLWCGISLPSSFPYSLQGAVFISNQSLYVLEVREQGEENGYWESESLPLVVLISDQLDHLSRVVMTSTLNQALYIELHSRSPVWSFVVFPPTPDISTQLFEQLKAALDAASLHYTVMGTHEAKTASGLSGVLFVKPDDFSVKRFKQWLSVSKTQVRLGNFIATNKNKSLLGMYEMEVKQGVRDLSESISIVHQLAVSYVSSDILPGCNGGSFLHPLILVLINSHLILCEEAFISGPALRMTQAKHTFSPLNIVQYIALEDIKEVAICDKLRPITASSSVPDVLLHHLTISFSDSCLSLAAYDLHHLNSFLGSLKLHWNSVCNKELSIVSVKTPLESFPNPHSPLPFIATQMQTKAKGKVSAPLFFKHLPLLRFANLPHWAKLDIFKEHIAQADFMKSDETILASFLAHSQPHLERRLDVEVFVIVSNYAMYFLSDMDGIRTWLDAGGISSFARMSLLSSHNDTHLQCFYRLWLSDLMKVVLGPLLLSIRLYDSKSASHIDVLTNTAQVTSLVLSALAATVGFKEKVQEKDVEHLLEDFVDITDDPFGEHTPAGPVSPIKQFAKRLATELVLPSDTSLNELKLHLVESHPDVARGSSVKTCSENIQILLPNIMLLAEQVRLREVQTVLYRPHMILLTNFGLFLCASSLNADVTPTLLVLSPTQLVVKRWIHIDDIQRVQVAYDSQYCITQLLIFTRAHSDCGIATHICIVPYTSVHAEMFVTLLGMVWKERMGRTLPVESSQ